MQAISKSIPSPENDNPVLDPTVDPVCGMKIDIKDPGASFSYKGRDALFCSDCCKDKFKATPDKYLTDKPVAAKLAELPTEQEIYTCPMHSQVRQAKPGNCPICGMTLEMVTATAGKEDNSEYRMMLKRFWGGVAFSVPLLFITMGGRSLIHSPGLLEHLKWIELILATPVVFWCGWPFLERFWQSIIHRSLNMFTLIGLSVGVAYGYSLVAVLLPSLFPPAFRDSMTGEVGLYFEAAAVIVTLVLLGQV